MDALFSHYVKAVREVLEAEGMKVPYLPPYGPDLNPIEEMWSKVKSFLLTWKIRNLELLPDAISMALACVSAQDFMHWFAVSADFLLTISNFKDCYNLVDRLVYCAETAERKY